MSTESASETILPLTLGMISDPPKLILVYKLHLPGDEPNEGKRRRRTMPLRDFTDKSDIKKFIFSLQQRHSKFLSSVPQVSLEKTLRIIQLVQGGLTVAHAVKCVDSEYGVSGDEDLNKISPEELKRKKDMMSESFTKHLLRPGDPGYIYDKEVTFDPRPGAKSTWDEEESSKTASIKLSNNLNTSAAGAETSKSKNSELPALGTTISNKNEPEEVRDENSAKDKKSDRQTLDPANPKSPNHGSDLDPVSDHETIGSDDFESEEEEVPFSGKELCKEYDFKRVDTAPADDDGDDNKENDEDDDDFWKF